jgi:hypothetical protein
MVLAAVAVRDWLLARLHGTPVEPDCRTGPSTEAGVCVAT